MAPSESLDTILSLITTSNNASALNHTLRTNLSKESRDTILASTLSSGQDPLTVLDMRENTLGVLWILDRRRKRDLCICQCLPKRTAISLHPIRSDPSVQPKAAILPLYDLVRRYPFNSSYLTSIHSIFALVRPKISHTHLPTPPKQACVSTHSFSALVPILENPITNIDTVLSPDLTYNDSLIYHYLGGVAFAALKRWAQAEEFFEIALSTPGNAPAAIQLEAFKKLKLVQLIATGKTAPLPKYTHSILPRLFKNSPYNTFVNAYPHNTELLNECVHREAATFSAEKNTGLIQQALARAPRWTLKKLTGTYVTLSLSDIAKAIRIESEDDVRALLLDMIESNDVAAQISADGTVTFSDPAPTFTKEQVDRVLADVQNQADLLNHLEREMAKNKEYLTKAVKTREESSWAPQAEEDLFISASGVWAEDVAFA
ncbi:hypothetical protein C0995_013511 [Termitomyces sp. Mi166|nr:hypothetical protein C0995_013511 [Termitomyces sp. Mi166\